jgi:hypothetical protein
MQQNTSTQKKSALVKRINNSSKEVNSKSKLDTLLGEHYICVSNIPIHNSIYWIDDSGMPQG